MRLAIILALALAACTGKNAAKGTVEYVPVVPLSVLEGAGGEPAEPDAAVGGEEAAGGALAPDAEVDAGAGDATFWAEPDAALPAEDAAGLPPDAAPAAGPECIPTVWTVDAGHDWSVVDEADPVARRCAGQCRRLANCSVGYTDGRDVDPCECIGDDDREQVLAECEWQCVSDPSMRILNTLETTETCGPMVAGLGGLDPFLEIACHGRPGGEDAGLPPDAAVEQPDAGPPEIQWAERPNHLTARVSVTAELLSAQTTVSAHVGEPERAPPFGCVTRMVDLRRPDDGGQGFDAGGIAVGGLSRDPVELVPQFDGTGSTYPPVAMDQRDVLGGGVITAESAGGRHFPPFHVEGSMPESPNVTRPQAAIGESYPASDPLLVQWDEAIAADFVTVDVRPAEIVQAQVEPRSGAWTTCRVDDAGTFTVPGGTLASITEGADFLGTPALVSVTRWKVSSTHYGQDVVEIEASASAAVFVTFVP